METNFLSNLVEKTAVKNMRFKKVAKEFSFLLAIFIVLKLLTSFVSVVAGYTYLNNLIMKVTQNSVLSVIITVVALFSIEFITQLSLTKLFKFVFKKQYRFMFIMLVMVGVFFFLSSVLSLKGIAIISSNKADLTAEIVNKYKDLETATINEFNQQKDYQKQQIELIKKQTWKGKLSYQHITEINEINNLIINIESNKQTALNDLKQQKQADLHENEINTQTSVSQYYSVVLIIMLVQLISNLVLNYFYLLIFKQRTEYLNDFVTTQQTEIKSNIIDLYKSMFTLNNTTMINGLQRAVIEKADLNEIESTPEPEPPEQLTAQKNKPELKKGFGFIIPNETRINETRTDKEIKKGTTTPTTKLNGVRVCKNCGKEYLPKHHVQKYCCEQCRIDFWQNKTGKKLKFKAKK